MPVVVLAAMLLASPVLAEEPPAWVRQEIGVIEIDGVRLTFAVGQASGEDPATTRARAGLAARQRLARILLDAAAPAPAPRARGRDSIFGDMMRQEVRRTLDEATLDGVEVRATWTAPDGSRTFAIATAPERAMSDALERVPMATEERADAESKLDGALSTLQRETTIAPEDIPNVAPQSFDEKDSTGRPAWVDFGCGRYDDDGEEVLFGVGVAKLANVALALPTSDNRARVELSRCVSFHIEQSGGSVKLFNANTLWGVRIVDHYYAPDGSVYALARVPTASLPAPEQEAVVKERLREQVEAPPKRPESTLRPSTPPKDVRAYGCPSPKQGKGLRVALGVIGPEARFLETAVRDELVKRRFRVLDPANRRQRADGQLVLKVSAMPREDTLESCRLEVEYLQGAETMNQGTYACRLGADPDEPKTVTVDTLRSYSAIAKCSIADNLWLAATNAKKARKKRRRR